MGCTPHLISGSKIIPLLYQTIHTPQTATITEKASKFIAYTFEINSKEEVKQYLDQLKKEHPKATHICYAYRFGLDKQDYRVNDDGEPSNSAGRPILHAIDSAKLTHVLVAVVRYYGGTKLGVPGLIHAYKLAAKEALLLSGTIEREVKIQIELTIPMLAYDKFRHAIKSYHVTILESSFIEESHQLTLSIPIRQEIKIREILNNLL